MIRYLSPSYNRADHCKTHKYLKDVCYVIHERERHAYSKLGCELWVIPDKIQGSIARVRNYILNNCDSPQILMLDDDVMEIGRYDNKGKSQKLKEEEVYEFVEMGFNMAEEAGVVLWGINLNADKGSYREYTPISFSNLILGPFSAHNNNPCRYDERITLKEDYDIAIQVLNRFRKILRFNAYHYVCDHKSLPGGCASYRTLEKEKEHFSILRNKWGSRIVTEDSGNSQVRRKKIKAYDVNPIIKIPIGGV